MEAKRGVLHGVRDQLKLPRLADGTQSTLAWNAQQWQQAFTFLVGMRGKCRVNSVSSVNIIVPRSSHVALWSTAYGLLKNPELNCVLIWCVTIPGGTSNFQKHHGLLEEDQHGRSIMCSAHQGASIAFVF